MSQKEHLIIRAPTLSQLLQASPPRSVTFDTEGKRFVLYLYQVSLQKEKIGGKVAYSFKAILAQTGTTLESYRTSVKWDAWELKGNCVPGEAGGSINER
ncbi:hypothetical protein A3E39_03585 [Candidatus Uhrbacteria bacterium RIFCSPHIGHO2_12_FULL_60_25]|uniref:Uncharacterized protein n=1 Tax=Candidatus Uhrbacteria bacterium RIFCSPHIGHO2_12_FULL_60_25 TaxID=1802399 RepID=A0A1F7UKX2_9BACT|nr:MAG: hypothetical protein A3D73_03600 [Candidatus Uhrbacteria bacterium RIFCSPHIGHO2_02_FULL_60_44]OGL78885.1 MAG: hypothetical protein A3E39_03585 [Candidatus Uhrbacteria bacterium RIFCSPHIGHO2_12_FULL_60_25]